MKYQKVVLKAHNTRYSEMSAGDKHRGPEKTFSIFYYFFSMTFPFCSFGIRFRELKCSFDGMFLCRSSCSSHFFFAVVRLHRLQLTTTTRSLLRTSWLLLIWQISSSFKLLVRFWVKSFFYCKFILNNFDFISQFNTSKIFKNIYFLYSD